MNKKGQELLGMTVGGILLFLIIFGLIALISIPFLNKGTSIDVAYGVEQNNLWTKLYLKDDHKTVYCIEDQDLIDLAKRASEEKLRVEVTYQEYVFKGSLCDFSEQYSGVVVKDIKIWEASK